MNWQNIEADQAIYEHMVGAGMTIGMWFGEDKEGIGKRVNIQMN